jgi:N12 class adenine-specific DNA methylase
MFKYPDSAQFAFPSSPVERFNLNRQAILIAKGLGDRQATAEEQAILAQYSGWGDTAVRKRGFDWRGTPTDPELFAALSQGECNAIAKSALNAHYTGLDVVRAMWGLVQRRTTGPSDGNVSDFWILEPSVGSGVFFGTSPYPEAKHIGVELDPLTAQITQALYPEATIKACGLESANLPTNRFDIVIGNVPFGNYGVSDSTIKFSFLKASTHDYFIAKSITLLKPNGHSILITSRYTLDKQDSAMREWLSRNAELLLAIRLPETAFQDSAGTDVVTDILVLRKRPQPITRVDDWVGTVEKTFEDAGTIIGRAYVSNYFEMNPAHMLGTYCRGKMQHGFSISVRPRPAEAGTLVEQIAQAGLDLAVAPPDTGMASSAPSADPAALNDACTLARRVYDRAKDLLQAQIKGTPTAPLRLRLNTAYDGYRARFGTFTMAAKTRHGHVLDPIKGEGWFAFLQALEDQYGGKAPLFQRDTLTAIHSPESGLKLSDALHVCLDSIGKLDISRLSQLTGLPTAGVEDSLANEGLAYLDPISSQWIPAAEYLSGNVRAKLQLAKESAALDHRFSRNVAALAAAQPAPLGPSEIKVSFGAGWLPAEYYVAFLRSLFPGTSWGIKVTRVDATASWIVEVTNPFITDSAENQTVYGAPRMTAIEIIQEGINLKIPVVYDEIEDADGSTRRVRNVQETAAVQGKLLEIRSRWESWLWADETRVAEICEIYNSKFNGFRLRQYDGGYLTFPGLAQEVNGKPYQLRQHQRSGVARILSQSEHDNSAFPVYPPGYGKTDTAICGVVKATQLGLIGKTCIVVPKHTLAQWRARFHALYPGITDELLAATDDSFSTQNRKRFLSRIVAGEAKYVLLTFEQFRTIPLSAETFNKYLSAELDDLRDYLNDSAEKSTESRALQKEFKKREKALAKFEAKYKERWEKMTKNGEAPITWEECGFTCVAVDECQYLKRDLVATKMENIAGLPRGESQRAFDARVKAHYTLSNKGKIVGLTGTPLTNTLAEAYVWLRFCQPQLLRSLGLWHFDAWASTFAEPFTSVEMDAVGNFRQQTRLRFQNIPELLAILAECWDRAPEAPEVKKPEIVGGQMRVVEVAGSPALIKYTESLAERAEAVRAKNVDPTVDNMLVITSDGRKASLFNGDPTLGFVPGVRTKVDALVDEVWRYYRESYAELGTQIIFCDLYTPKEVEEEDNEQEDVMTSAERFTAFGIYGVIKERLAVKGILPGEIEFAHDARNDAERLAQHDRMNRGRCRVIIGSTGKMGTGVNVQDCVYAVHHLDCPWRPDELEQRTARGVRDGNRWPAIHVLCYVTQRSYDPVVWQLVEYKGRIVQQIMSGRLTSRSADDIGSLVLTAGMAKAIALGDSRVVDKIRLEMELSALERQYKSWNDTRLQLRYEARKIPERIEASRKEIDEHREAADLLRHNGGEFRCVLREIGGDRLEVQATAQAASEHVRKLANLLGRTIRTRPVAIGSLQGLNLFLENWHGTLTLVARVKDGVAGYRVQGLTYQNARSIEQLQAELNHIDTTSRRVEAGIKTQESRLRTAETELAKPWGPAGRASELLDKYRLLCQELEQNGMVDAQRFNLPSAAPVTP